MHVRVQIKKLLKELTFTKGSVLSVAIVQILRKGCAPKMWICVYTVGTVVFQSCIIKNSKRKGRCNLGYSYSVPKLGHHFFLRKVH